MACRKDGKHLVLEVAVKVDLIVEPKSCADLLEGHPVCG